jgi:peroxiredoxin Q/BCP
MLKISQKAPDFILASSKGKTISVKFAKKYGLSYPLLSDEKKETVKTYGVWKEKSMYGKKYFGIERTTVVIDENGIVQQIFKKVKVDGHTEEVLSLL